MGFRPSARSNERVTKMSNEARAKNLAGDIREAWECAIEEDLFCGVVLRSSAT